MGNQKLHPLKFQPLFKYRMWGGEKLKNILNKDYVEKNIGESWEISDVDGDQTFVKEGQFAGRNLTELIQEFKERLVGRAVYHSFGEQFPLLIKFIDAKTPLSIQVHPSDDMAKQRHNSFGKNEMWYVMQADEDAELIVGFDGELDQQSYQKHLANNTLLEAMHYEKVKTGDTFYIPAGRVHAIGAGVMLAEIQQTSDVTYRIYDYDRVDAQSGEKRELHNDFALDVIDFVRHENYKTTYELTLNTSRRLVHSPFFKTNILEVTGDTTIDLSEVDSFKIYICVEGELKIMHGMDSYSLGTGETILIPAEITELTFDSKHAIYLEVFL